MELHASRRKPSKELEEMSAAIEALGAKVTKLSASVDALIAIVVESAADDAQVAVIAQQVDETQAKLDAIAPVG